MGARWGRSRAESYHRGRPRGCAPLPVPRHEASVGGPAHARLISGSSPVRPFRRWIEPLRTGARSPAQPSAGGPGGPGVGVIRPMFHVKRAAPQIVPPAWSVVGAPPPDLARPGTRRSFRLARGARRSRFSATGLTHLGAASRRFSVPQAPRGGVSRDDGYSCPHNYMLPTKGHCRPPTVTTARSGLAPPPARAWRGRTSPLRSPRDGTVVRCVDAPDRRPWCLPHRWAARIIEPPPSGAPRHTRRTRRRHLRDDRP
jgi:hypothetical protein